MSIKCPECQSSFRYKKHINAHLITIDTHKPYKCTQCKNAYFSRSTLTRHMKTKHNGITYNCKECDFTSSRKDHLNWHIRLNHELKQGDECELTTYATVELKKHKSSHVPEDIEEESVFKNLVY